MQHAEPQPGAGMQAICVRTACTSVLADEVLSARCAAVVFAARRIIPLEADPVPDLAIDGANVPDRRAIAADLHPGTDGQTAEQRHGGGTKASLRSASDCRRSGTTSLWHLAQAIDSGMQIELCQAATLNRNKNSSASGCVQTLDCDAYSFMVTRAGAAWHWKLRR